MEKYCPQQGQPERADIVFVAEDLSKKVRTLWGPGPCKLRRLTARDKMRMYTGITGVRKGKWIYGLTGT